MKKLTILLLFLFCIVINSQTKELNLLSNKFSICKYNPVTQEMSDSVDSEQINTINIDKDLSYITIHLLSDSEIIETAKYKVLNYKVVYDKDLGETILKLFSKDEKDVKYDFFLTTKFFMIRSKYNQIGHLMIYDLWFPNKDQ